MIQQLYHRYEGEPHEETHQSSNITDKLKLCHPHLSFNPHMERVPQEYPDLDEIVPRIEC